MPLTYGSTPLFFYLNKWRKSMAKKKASTTQVEESAPLSPLHLAKHNKVLIN
jgi:hypothetical protein